MNPDLDIDLLRSFAAVADSKQFTLAAKRLNKTQSAISMQIRRLEDVVGSSLFDRSRRQIKLTSEGEKLRSYAANMLRLNDEILAAFGRETIQGRIRVAATDTSMPFLPMILSRFAESYPLIELEIACCRSWDALDDFDDGKFDVAIVTQPCGRTTGKVVRREPLVWAAAKGSSVATLDPLPLALFGEGCIYRQTALDALDAAGRGWRHAYNSPSRDGLDVAVTAGLAVTVTAQSVLPATWTALDKSLGFPRLPKLEIILYARDAMNGSAQEPCAAFTEIATDVLRQLPVQAAA